ncbi:hypothetical protein CONCODRAFT_6491 [Conidiobolus coronatus NRRL 28638]|uniref:Galactose oxidase n=1 Tax=Conidiobolus coronatus (strain ATCC 28846 / CBS 209.66 / NRRL 28638) TaxID=796925 RepID=A0A137P792_CONC2|nr:hypothetical protein CONCODRAFT_6491 [Conidiobolus coronatus NRRL 28638]|eukprot:KXN70868.1 hypothetical protein CONCODRAFT_6491 [Conidiobolus coronatus NRRL 28638]
MDELYSIAIRGNKVTAVYFDYQLGRGKTKVYELKSRSISDIVNNEKVSYLDFFNNRFKLKKFDASNNLQEDKNKLWLRFELIDFSYNNATLPFMNYVEYMDLADMSLKNSTSFKFPKDEKFPIREYTVNKIMNEFGSALYITGGSIYSKKDGGFQVTNSFYKYNFTSKEWVDMAYSINEKLKPLVGHKSVVIDNRYLVILGGNRPIVHKSVSDIMNSTLPTDEFNSIYNLTVFDTFTNKWDNVNIKPDVFDTSVTTVQFDQFIATVYNDKIIVLGGYTAENRSKKYDINKYFGILDFKSKNWTWIPMLNEDGSNYNSNEIHKDFLIFNDQLIIFSDYIRSDKDIPFKVYDMLSKRMKLTLRLANSSNIKDSENDNNETNGQHKALPTYAITLTALSCVVIFLSLIYLFYHKNKNKSISNNGKIKYKGPIREIWANQDIDNALNTITRDNKKDLTIKKNNPKEINSNRLDSDTDIIEFNK